MRGIPKLVPRAQGQIEVLSKPSALNHHSSRGNSYKHRVSASFNNKTKQKKENPIVQLSIPPQSTSIIILVGTSTNLDPLASSTQPGNGTKRSSIGW
ncbi:hypothetical protein M407DRAFT_195688 [Tulasnella calospora MUT 4182]|uniref:Uncharacterized protein n=1 Tax=Tulasnella calospora MUT 4182 TaxID=1051891 RepID=A0A0C3PNQ8_9AGAM|nr:hypothetical protein M407DRAFT_195688 [Tulasnella calospora MUT 4182]